MRTAYGDSDDYASSTVDVKFQGLCQENGAAPAGWAVISIMILQGHKAKVMERVLNVRFLTRKESCLRYYLSMTLT